MKINTKRRTAQCNAMQCNAMQCTTMLSEVDHWTNARPRQLLHALVFLNSDITVAVIPYFKSILKYHYTVF